MTQEAGDTGKGTLEQNGVLAILRLALGAGVTPAQGSVKPTVGFTLNQVIYPSRRAGDYSRSPAIYIPIFLPHPHLRRRVRPQTRRNPSPRIRRIDHIVNSKVR